jgi:hypothetical protein
MVNPGSCGAECIPDGQQTKCQPGDGCCPSACNGNNDSDCPAKCGNGVKEAEEDMNGQETTDCSNGRCPGQTNNPLCPNH